MTRAPGRAPPPSAAANATAAHEEAPPTATRKRAARGEATAERGGKKRKLTEGNNDIVVEVQVSSLSLDDDDDDEEEEEKAAVPPERRTRTSFGSDGSSALGGSEGSQSQSQSHSSVRQSLSASPTSVAAAPVPMRNVRDDADLVLHVDGCAFRVHSFQLQAVSFRLCKRVTKALRQPVPRPEHGEASHYSVVGTGPSKGQAETRPTPITPVFKLRRVDGARYLSAGITTELALSSAPIPCPLDAPDATAKTAPFTFVSCVAHANAAASVASGSSGGVQQHQHDERTSPRDALRTRLQLPPATTSSDRSENNRLQHQQQDERPRPPSRRRQQAHDVLAELESEQERQQHEMASQRFAVDATTQQQSPPLRATTSSQRELQHLEWRLADPVAVATVLEFVYTRQVRLVDPSSAFCVVQLAYWMGGTTMAPLLHACLANAIARVTLQQWVYLFFVSVQQADETTRNALVEKLLAFIRTFPPDRSAEIVAHVQLECLAFIKDRDLLGRVVMCFVNHVRHMGAWRNLLFTIDCWGRNRVGRAPDAPFLSLVEFHHLFAPWDPFVTLPGVEFGGEKYYVAPRTLVRFGDFALQVRFEMDSLALIQWRVVKEPRADTVADTVAVGIRRSDPSFTLRGEMKVRYRCYRAGPTHEQLVTLRYTHSVHEYGVWKPLVRSSSETARVLPPVEVRATRAAEGAPSQSETEASQSQSQNQPAEREAVEEFLRARFVARAFVWGHRLSNLSHYILSWSLFYSAPHGTVGELTRRSTLDKMRRVPVDTLVLTLQSDRLRVPRGETTLVEMITFLCFNVDRSLESARKRGRAAGLTDYSNVAIVRVLFGCVRWCYADMNQIMRTLERSDRKYELYELIASGINDPLLRFPRREPSDDASSHTYEEVTTLVEFEIEAGDRSLSPSFFSQDPSSLLTPSSAEV